MTHFPYRCSCGAPLVIHCGSHTCTWLRCPNDKCVWGAVDMERGVRTDRDGHCEAVA
jgi:hypothetical protein